MIVGEMRAVRPGLRPAGSKSRRHPRGGVRGLESIGTPSSAPLSGDTQPMWRMEEEGSPRLEV